MHPYYAQKQAKLKKEMIGYLSLISSELEKETGVDWQSLLEEIWTCYLSDMLEHFPYIGGDKASGTKNLTGAFCFVAMGEVCCKRYGMPLERWGQLTTICYQRYFEKIPSFMRKMAGKLVSHPALITKLLAKKDKKNAANAAANLGSFVTKVQPATSEYPVRYDTLVCPLANFARDFGYLDYMPYICNLDYVMFESCGVPFYREHTCASGDDYCDFKLKANAPGNSAWPCHSLTPGDRLK